MPRRKRTSKYAQKPITHYERPGTAEAPIHFTLFEETREIVTSTNRAELIRLASELSRDRKLETWTLELPNRGFGFFRQGSEHPVYAIKIKCK